MQAREEISSQPSTCFSCCLLTELKNSILNLNQLQLNNCNKPILRMFWDSMTPSKKETTVKSLPYAKTTRFLNNSDPSSILSQKPSKSKSPEAHKKHTATWPSKKLWSYSMSSLWTSWENSRRSTRLTRKNLRLLGLSEEIIFTLKEIQANLPNSTLKNLSKRH